MEEILKNEELPFSINNELVVVSYDEYINDLKKIMPEKAKRIEDSIKEYNKLND